VLWQATPEDRNLQNEGLLWLKEKAWADQNWARVWSYLRNVHHLSQELDHIAKDLLQITPATNASWGHVWPVLFRTDPADPMLYDLGRVWLSSAPPFHAGWSDIWPLMSSAWPNDSEVESVGREWLERASPAHGGWNQIWEALWAKYPHDEALLADAFAWLDQAPADHGGWARVWQLAWTERVGSRPLEALARHWIESGGASPNHAGWPFVFACLVQWAPDDVSFTECGLGWLRSVEPSNKGWANVWRSMWDCKQRTEETEQSKGLVALGRKWLESSGVAHNGFSLVWERLWNRSADDQLRRLALDRLWQHSNDSTWMYIWLPLSRTLPNDSTLTKQGIALLRDGIPRDHPQWNVVWSDLFKRDSGNIEVRKLGEDWLHDWAGSALGWEGVWKQLWDNSPADPLLVATGVTGLGDASATTCVWKIVWRSMFAVLGADNPEVGSTAIRWLQSPRSHRVEDLWCEVAQDLRNCGQLPNDLDQVLRLRDVAIGTESEEVKRCRKVAETYSYARKWLDEWQAVWRPNYESLLVTSGLRWLADAVVAKTIPPSFPYVWNRIYLSDRGRPELIELGRRWLRAKNSGARAWGLVWRGLMRDIFFDLNLVREGVAWIDNIYFDRSTWPEVWATLWDLGLTDRANLADAALSWLSLPDPTRRGYANVWCRLWDSSIDRTRLHSLGLAFTKLASSHEGWIEVVLKIGLEGRAVGELRERVAEWCARNSDDPSARPAATIFSLAEEPPSHEISGGTGGTASQTIVQP